MSERSPSGQRRRGHNAFYPGGNVDDANPYFTEYKRQNFAEGWAEAALAHKQAEVDKPDTSERDYLIYLCDDAKDIYELRDVLRQLILKVLP